MRKIKILFISHFPLDDCGYGGVIRSGFMLRALKEIGDVTTVLGTTKGPKLKWFMMIPFMSSKKLMDGLYRERDGILKELGLEGEKFDCVVVRLMRSMHTNAAWKIAPCFLDIDDLPSQVAATLHANKPWLWRMPLVFLLRIWQIRLIRRSTAFWVSNPDQKPLLEKHGLCATLHNIVAPPGKGYDFGRVASERFLTVGGMSYSPNSDGVDWFICNVWPQVLKQHPNAVYNIVGGGVPDKLAEKWGRVCGVRVLGFVKDLSVQYEMASAVIAPIFAGAGTSIKVREAAIHGRKTFATPFAARGLTDEECKSLGVTRCPTVEAFISEIDAYLTTDDSVRSIQQIKIARDASERISYERFADTVRELILKGLYQHAK